MAGTVTVGTTPTSLDDGSATRLEVGNTGAIAAHIEIGPFAETIPPNGSRTYRPAGVAVVAYTLTGTTTLAVDTGGRAPGGGSVEVTGGADRTLSNLTDVPAARGNLGLGSAATRSVGTGAGSVAAGDDERLTGAAQKAANLTDLTNPAAARTALGLGGAALLPVGTGSGSVAAGDDSRLSNARTPSAHAASHAGAGSDPVTLAQAQVTGLPAALTAKADLVSGKVPISQLPSLVINETFTVASQVEMLALSAQQGDVAIRTDFTPAKFYWLAQTPASTLGNWTEITLSGAVSSVVGQTGAVTGSQILADSTVAAALTAKADAAATTTALAGKAATDLSNVTAATGRTALGLGNVATRNVGTTTGTAAAGDDTRIVGAAQRAGGNAFTGTQDFSGASVIGLPGASVSLPQVIVAATNAPTAWKNATSYDCSGTDDAAVINSAINALTTFTGGAGGEVILSPGTFTIGKASPTDTGITASNSDSSIQVRSDITLRGQGMGVTVVKLRDSFAHGITGILRTRDSSSESTSRAVIRDLTVDGNLANQAAGASAPRHIGLFIGSAKSGQAWCEDILIERVEVKGCRSYAFDPHERSRRLTFRDCKAHDNGIMGSSNTYEQCAGFTFDWVQDSHVEGCESWANSDHGFELVTYARRNVLTGCKAWGNGQTGFVLQRGTPDTATLSAAISTTGATTFTVSGTLASALGTPSNGVTGDPNLVLKVDSEELVLTGASGGTATVQRGAFGTTAATHANGATVQRVGILDPLTGLVARSSDFNTLQGCRAWGNKAQGVKVVAHRNEITGNALEYNCLTVAGLELDVAATATAPTFGATHNHVADNRITTGTVDAALRAGANLATYAVGESNAACDWNSFISNHVEGTPSTGVSVKLGTHSTLADALTALPETQDQITWASGAYLLHDATQLAGFATFRDRPVQCIAVFPSHNTQAELANAWYLSSPYIPAGYTGDIALAMPMCSDGNTVAQDCSAQMTSLANTLNGKSNRFWIRLGWEMNLGPSGWPWKVTDGNLSTWRSRWTTYYNIFKGVMGAKAQVGFNPNGGGDQSGITGGVMQAWVDGKVDWCGPDQYDCYPPFTNGTNISSQLGRSQGLDFWASTARTKGVQLALPEWGVSSGTQWAGNCGNDNPAYITAMRDWMVANKDIMAFDAYFNEPASYVRSELWLPTGHANLPVQNPLAAARYQQLFGIPA